MQISAEKIVRINRKITAKEIRLISVEGEQAGIVNIEEALQSSENAGLDLVEISPNAKPPVCRIMDYGKFLYQQEKKKGAAKKKQKQTQVKQLTYRPNIEEGDYQVKLRKLIKFLQEGDKIKVSVRFRGREIAHHQIGVDLLKRIQADLEPYGAIEQTPRFEGRQVVMIMGTKKN